MAGSLNKVLLIGRLGNDPEIREFPNGGKVCNFSLATSESWKDNNTGERQERTSWHNIAIFNERLAEIAEQYLKKGSQIYVEGRIQTRKWQDRDGNDRYTTEIVGNDMQMLGGSRRNDNDEGYRPSENNNPPSEAPQEGPTSGASSNNTFIEDDIPF